MHVAIRSTLALAAVVGLLASSAWGRAEHWRPDNLTGERFAAQSPDVRGCVAAHRVGQLVLAVNNNGTFGTGFSTGIQGDCFTGAEVRTCEYPKGSGTEYLYAGSFWIGAVVGRDTVVSLGADGWSFTQELFPHRQTMIRRSIINPDRPEYDGAISEEDFIATYTDTFTQGIPPDLFGQPHIPLQVSVQQNSYAWSYAYAEDFVLFDYQITSMNSQVIKDVYMGIYVDADVFGSSAVGYSDDLTGFIETIDRTYGACTYEEVVNTAWLADNDGDFNEARGVPDVTATRVVRTPAESLQVSYNWWFSSGSSSLDFGPRERPGVGRLQEPFRDFNIGSIGTPEGDRNKYYTMRNQELDYDQAKVASIGPNDTLWLLPNPQNVESWATGADTRYLLSFGPFEILPGQTLPLSFAYIGGRGLHRVVDNLSNLPYNYEAYYDNLDFSDLAENAMWASWIYDNPGVDTDSDGYFGEYRLCVVDSVEAGGDWTPTVVDTVWYIGDGVPDFQGATPPPAPWFTLKPSYKKIHVRFNGTRSETTKDLFTRAVDFEGYRIYVGRDNRSTSYSLVASYDREDYSRLVWNPSRQTWDPSERPYTREELACQYGDSCNDPTFDPLQYTQSRPWVDPDSAHIRHYFRSLDYNQAGLGGVGEIRRVYPDQPPPSHPLPDSADPSELTEEGFFKYYEYEYEIESLLPTVPYFVNVTAFDYGSPKSGLPPLESSVSLGAQDVVPLTDPDAVLAGDAEVFVYPNPYRSDGAYRGLGFEGRDAQDRPDDRVRRVHFANLPLRCTIKIFTVDGDLVREIEHDKPATDPNASYEEWNLITRNTQMVVSGLYYWTVEAEGQQTQIGKLVIIQ